MVSAKDASGNRLCISDGFLSASQITGFFFRLSAKKTLHDEAEECEDDFQSAANEARIEELTNVAVHELQLEYPITYDVYKYVLHWPRWYKSKSIQRINIVVFCI